MCRTQAEPCLGHVLSAPKQAIATLSVSQHVASHSLHLVCFHFEGYQEGKIMRMFSYENYSSPEDYYLLVFKLKSNQNQGIL